MAAKGFFEVTRLPATTSQGPFDLPVLYYDVSVRQLLFWVDYDKALPKLAGTGLVPTAFSNSKTIVSIVFYNYRRVSDIDPYEELALGITAELQSAKKGARRLRTFFGIPLIGGGISSYVLELPVTTDQACAGGRELWGYPKFVTRLPFKFQETGFEFGALYPGSDESIVSVKAELGKSKGFGMRGFDLVTYSNLNDKILRTVINIEARYRMYTKRPVVIKVSPEHHRLADNFRDLGLDRTQPFMIFSTDAFHSRLNRGEPVAVWITPPLPYAVTK